MWAGDKIIKGDPRRQNSNGKLFQTFLLQNLSVVNANPICEGKITRIRHTKERTEESILDFFIVCNQILSLLTKMIVDIKGEISMTRYRGKVVKSDHRMLKLEVNLEFHKEKKHDRVEVFNVRNVKCQKVFWEYTSKDNMLSKCFNSQDEDINIQFKRWQRRFRKAIYACFKKVRIQPDTNKKLSKMDELMIEKKNILRKKTLTKIDEDIIEDIETQITGEIADKELNKLEKIVGDLEADTNKNIWNELRKAYPKNSKPLPTGVKNIQGKVITNPKEKMKVTLEHFEHRMRKRQIKEETKDIANINSNLFKIRLKNARTKKSLPFEMHELEKVLKQLKAGKSKDPDNYVNELFKIGVIGDDLKSSLLMMMNRIKK